MKILTEEQQKKRAKRLREFGKKLQKQMDADIKKIIKASEKPTHKQG